MDPKFQPIDVINGHVLAITNNGCPYLPSNCSSITASILAAAPADELVWLFLFEEHKNKLSKIKAPSQLIPENCHPIQPVTVWYLPLLPK